MDKLAQWAGLRLMVNHTGKLAWFRVGGRGGNEFVFVANKFDWKPNLNPIHFDLLMTKAINSGAAIRVEKITVKTSMYMNIKAVIEIDGKVFTHLTTRYQLSIVRCLERYVNNLDL